jgi:hypothetical protein
MAGLRMNDDADVHGGFLSILISGATPVPGISRYGSAGIES